MGHAAGFAPAQAVRGGLAFKDVDSDALREALAIEGAVVGLVGGSRDG
jgi:hypothetical protein